MLKKFSFLNISLKPHLSSQQVNLDTLTLFQSCKIVSLKWACKVLKNPRELVKCSRCLSSELGTLHIFSFATTTMRQHNKAALIASKKYGKC